MRERISRAFERPRAGAYRRSRSHTRGEYGRARFGGLDGARLLHELDLVGHAGREIDLEEAVGDDGQEENGGGDQDGEPEDCARAHVLRRADVVPALAEYVVDVLAVERKVE